MRQDLLYSFLLHFIVIIAMVISTPFKPKVRTNFGEVITVNLTAMPMISTPQAIEPMPIPTPIVVDEPVTPVMEVASINKAAAIDKPKPKKKKEDKPYRPKAETGQTDRTGAEEGQKDVSENLNSGSRFGGASVDNASFNYPYWFTQAFIKIERNWSNPVYANQALSCTIYFQVISSGRIIKVEIEESSGIDAYDRACERAVNLSQPLPPLPENYTDEILGIHLIFPYAPG
jgi:TonB family protein